MSKRFFLITLPRSGGTAVQRMLDATPGVACCGETGSMLERVCAMESVVEGMPGGWRVGAVPVVDLAAPEGVCYGVRSSYLGREGWSKAVARWSWLLRRWPDAVIVFVTREVDDGAEITLSMTWNLWIPSFAKCAGRLWKRWREMRQSMLDFREMNPGRVAILPMEKLGDFEAVAGVLAAVGIPLAWEAWEQVNASRPGERRAAVAELVAVEKAAKLSPVPNPFDGDRDPFAAVGNETDGSDDPFEAEDAARDPFPAPIKPARRHRRQPPRPFIEMAAEVPRAIVYPWLSTAAVWQELRHSLRSVAEHFEDKECPIFILGDAPPPWLRPGGRVQWRAIQGYAPERHGQPLNRRAGMWQATVTGVQLAEEVCWMNDDIYFLRATRWEDLRVALTEGRLERKVGEMLASTNVWRRGLARAVCDLLDERPLRPVWRFATHTPYLFEREKSLAILRTYRLSYKGSWVTLYHNHHNTPHEPCAPHKVNRLPATAAARFLNHSNYTLTEDLKGKLEALFPTPAPWEAT